MKDLNFITLETTRIKLRKPTKKDEMRHYEYQKDPENFPNVDMLVYKDINQVSEYFNNMKKGIDNGKWLFWVIADKHSDIPIGTISLWNINKKDSSGELGYGLYPDSRGKGLMTEAINTVLAYGFNVLEIKKVYAWTDHNNIQSIKLLESLGFKYIKTAIEEAHSNEGTMTYNVYTKEK